jgi:hypothetical protein
LLDQTLRKLGIAAEFHYVEGKDHMTLYQGGLTERLQRRWKQWPIPRGLRSEALMWVRPLSRCTLTPESTSGRRGLLRLLLVQNSARIDLLRSQCGDVRDHCRRRQKCQRNQGDEKPIEPRRA